MKLNRFLAYKLEAVSGNLFIKFLTPITFIPSTILIFPASEYAEFPPCSAAKKKADDTLGEMSRKMQSDLEGKEGDKVGAITSILNALVPGQMNKVREVTNARSEGLIISVNGLSGKVLGGVGVLLSGLLLSLAGFGEEGSIEEKREAVTNLAIFSTSLLYIIAPISL